MTELSVRIIGTDSPGTRCAGHERVHVGVQRGDEVVGIIPARAESTAFELSVQVVGDAHGIDFRGPYVHGRRGARFLYLSWGELDDQGNFHMFRRAKLDLTSLPPELVNQAAVGGAGVEGVLSLTDPKGGPVCASVRPPALRWRLASAGSPGMEPGGSGRTVNG
jgi:hypothetical protein